MRLRFVVLGLAAILLMAAAPLLMRAGSEVLARRIAAALVEVGHFWSRPHSTSPVSDDAAGLDAADAKQKPSRLTPSLSFDAETSADTNADVDSDGDIDPPGATQTASQIRERADPKHPPSSKHAIFISRSVVSAAIRAGSRPSAVPVAATDRHPRGLRVTGWPGAGGLHVGDVITAVAGRTPTSVQDVVTAVVAAYQAKSLAISGQFWRNGELWTATVELPEAVK